MSRATRPRIPGENPPDLPKRDMTHWYDPGQLLSTGVQVFTSAALGQRADYRRSESVWQGVFDRADEATASPGEIWFDYMADTGDGWDSTHAMACLVAQPQLAVGERTLPRGRFLLLGGDEVYPAASRQAYRERLVAPFEAALPATDLPSPQLFAIPGNHDWYDGLATFSSRFLQRRWVGGWETRQTRSYFAIKLPHRWWLFAVDIQLESDIDDPQLDYFRGVVNGDGDRRGIGRGDRIILATAEPDWLYRDIKDPVTESRLGFLEEQIIKPTGAQVHLWLAGDLHHYRRHESVADRTRQRIVSGGGGAYVAATHKPFFGPEATPMRHTVTVGDERFQQRRAFPSPTTSFRLSLINCFFLFRNWRFALLPAIAYTGLTWGSRPTHPPDFSPAGLGDAFLAVLEDAQSRVFVLLVVLASFVFFTYYSGRGNPDGRLFRLIGGFLHGCSQIACALTIAYWAAGIFRADRLEPLWRLLVNFAGGAIVGSALWGIYLLVAYSIFGAHSDESFAALRIKDYKNFLRLHIRPDGALEIFAIGVTKVPRRRDARGQYMLIEEPIVIPPQL